MGRGLRAGLSLALVALLCAVGWPIVIARPAAALVLQTHAQIFIDGNAALTSANGVTGGSGTPTDPFVIEGWDIQGASAVGLQIRNTDAYVLVRDLAVTGSSQDGLSFYNTQNVVVDNVSSILNSYAGMRWDSSRDFAVLRSNVSFNRYGIVTFATTTGLLEGNVVSQNQATGILLQQSPFVTVADNTIDRNYDPSEALGGNGLVLFMSENITVRGNRFAGNGLVVNGVDAADWDSLDIAADNRVNGAPLLFYRNCRDLDLHAVAVGQLLLLRCQNVRVSNLTFERGSEAVVAAYSSNLTIGPGLVMTNASTAVRLWSSDEVRVVGNHMYGDGYGVDAALSSVVQVQDNRILSYFPQAIVSDGVFLGSTRDVNVSNNVIENHLVPVRVYLGQNTSVIGNKIVGNAVGVTYLNSSVGAVLGNKIAMNGGRGIFLAFSDNLSVVGNVLFLSPDAGIELNGTVSASIYHNDVTFQNPSALDNRGPENQWDDGYPSGGNHWMDYIGTDACSGPNQNQCGQGDGIGDTPYVIDANTTDRYPVMRPPVVINTPPDAFFAVSPRSGTNLTTFTVNATLASDLEDVPLSLSVRWDWENDGAWDTPLSMSRIATHRYARPGNYTVRMEIVDSEGLSDNTTLAVRVDPKPDNTAPQVLVSAPASVLQGEPIPITANVTDPSGVVSVTLYYTGTSGAAAQIVMNRTDGANYRAVLPAQATPGQVTFYMVATDGWENAGRSPAATDVYRVSVLASFPWLIVSVGTLIVAAGVGGFAYWWWRRKKNTRVPGTLK